MNSSHIPLLFVYVLPIILNLLTLIMINVLIFRIDTISVRNKKFNRVRLIRTSNSGYTDNYFHVVELQIWVNGINIIIQL